MTNHHVVILDCCRGCPTSIRIEAGRVDITSTGYTNVTCNRCDAHMVVRLATMPHEVEPRSPAGEPSGRPPTETETREETETDALKIFAARVKDITFVGFTMVNGGLRIESEFHTQAKIFGLIMDPTPVGHLLWTLANSMPSVPR